MSVFLDSNFFISIANKKDKYHQQALQLSASIKEKAFGDIFTSTYVVDETLTNISSKQGHELAVGMGKIILDSEITVLDVDRGTFDQAWILFQEKNGLSFTDCTIVKIIENNRIKNLASFDSGFRQFRSMNILS